MNRNAVTATLATGVNCSLDQLEDRVQEKLCGRVRDLRIHLHDSGIVLRGLTGTYHAKQLAQHAVMTETDFPILANEIEVC